MIAVTLFAVWFSVGLVGCLALGCAAARKPAQRLEVTGQTAAGA